MTTSPQHPDKLASRVLQRIDTEHVVPLPRIAFLLQNYGFWSLAAFTTLLGALAFSATMFEVANANWRLSVATHPDLFSYFLASAPFLWVGALSLFILLGYLNIKRTKHGYRYTFSAIALVAVLSSLILGSGIYALGFGGQVEESLGDHPGFYRPILVQERSAWLAPEKGLLGGAVVQTASDTSSFQLRDFKGQTWQVDTSDLNAQDITAITDGSSVHVVGTPNTATSSEFHACFVFPWETYGEGKSGKHASRGNASDVHRPRAAQAKSDECKNIGTYQKLKDIDDAED